MSAQLAKVRNNVEEPDVIVLGGSEIASISGRTVEVFFYGPKPKVVEQLVIEPGPEVAQGLTNRIRPLAEPVDLLTQVYVACEEGRLIMNWKRCRPDLRTFLQQVAQACPSVVIAPEERSELDLNVIWNGLREKPNADQRKMLLTALPALTLMLYELSSPTDGKTTDEKAAKLKSESQKYLQMAVEGLDASSLAKISIGLRTPDYGNLLPQMLETLDQANQGNPLYGGWARHSYNDVLTPQGAGNN